MEANPADEQAVRTYENELLRAGDRASVVKRYRFKFLCARGFDDLEPTDDPEERFCRDCQRNVRFVHLVDELEEEVTAGNCVAIEEQELGGVIEGFVEDQERHSGAERGSSCVVLGERPVTYQWRGQVEPLPRDDDPLQEWEQQQQAREAEEEAFWNPKRAGLQKLQEGGAEAYLVLDSLKGIDFLLDDPSQPGAWTIRIELPLDQELVGQFTLSGDTHAYDGRVRNGLLRLIPQSGEEPPAWNRGDVVVRQSSRTG